MRWFPTPQRQLFEWPNIAENMFSAFTSDLLQKVISRSGESWRYFSRKKDYTRKARGKVKFYACHTVDKNRALQRLFLL